MSMEGVTMEVDGDQGIETPLSSGQRRGSVGPLRAVEHRCPLEPPLAPEGEAHHLHEGFRLRRDPPVHDRGRSRSGPLQPEHFPQAGARESRQVSRGRRALDSKVLSGILDRDDLAEDPVARPDGQVGSFRFTARGGEVKDLQVKNMPRLIVPYKEITIEGRIDGQKIDIKGSPSRAMSSPSRGRGWWDRRTGPRRRSKARL